MPDTFIADDPELVSTLARARRHSCVEDRSAQACMCQFQIECLRGTPDVLFAVLDRDNCIWHSSWTPANLMASCRELNEAFQLGWFACKRARSEQCE